MATLPAFLRRTETPNGQNLIGSGAREKSANQPHGGGSKSAARGAHPFPAGGPYRLRALPQEDVFFIGKKIDNYRLVREADPKAPGACWSAIGVAAIAVALLVFVLAPNLMSTLAGYELERLRAEQRSLIDERHNLEFKQAELLNVNRLERLAKEHNLSQPTPGQLVHLNGKDSSVAMVEHQ